MDAVIIKGPRPLASKSKYINKLWIVDNLEQGYQLIIDKYADVNEKSFYLRVVIIQQVSLICIMMR